MPTTNLYRVIDFGPHVSVVAYLCKIVQYLYIRSYCLAFCFQIAAPFIKIAACLILVVLNFFTPLLCWLTLGYFLRLHSNSKAMYRLGMLDS